MREINKILIIFFCFFFIVVAKAESKVLSIGSPDAKVTVKVFSSLTCPHCANFHIAIFNNLKKDYIDKGLVKFEHHAFPLDLAALNAEVIVRCASNNEKKFKLLDQMYICCLLTKVLKKIHNSDVKFRELNETALWLPLPPTLCGVKKQ